MAASAFPLPSTDPRGSRRRAKGSLAAVAWAPGPPVVLSSPMLGDRRGAKLDPVHQNRGGVEERVARGVTVSTGHWEKHRAQKWA